MNKLKTNIEISFKGMNWKLLGVIFFTLLIPATYKTVRIFIIGTIPNTYSLSIAGNMQWISVFFEILEETFLLPLFFTIRTLSKNSNERQRNNKISYTYFMIIGIYLIAISLAIILSKNLMHLLSVNNINDESINFVRIEFSSRLFMMIGKVSLIFLIAKKSVKEILIIVFISSIINILLDTFVVSNNDFSLKKGIIWIAVNGLIINFLTSIIYIMFVYRKYEFNLRDVKPIRNYDWKHVKQYFWIGSESLLRNLFFIFFVIKIINRLDSGYDQGSFWVFNTFMWGWLLLPIISISQYINRDKALNIHSDLMKRVLAPFFIILTTIIVWICMIPLYSPIIKYVFNQRDYKVISDLILISIGFYALFALNDPLDKLMIGDGKAQYIFLQSLIVNICVYIPYYYLKSSITIYDIAIMMGIAIALDSLITIGIFIYIYKYKISRQKHNSSVPTNII